ncbi:MAG: hypothetical protein EON54_20860 [Alcaligenaceae bacterium]|nr:MAG: hypothetical protein EON54_20860 [Alcaligenaceae bacterium]
MRKPKVNAAEAAASIAAELQQAINPNTFEPGQRVRLKADIAQGVDVFHTRDVMAEVQQPEDDRSWRVMPDNLSFSIVADYTQMEAIEP